MNATNKTIYLVTGAAGFLGGTICRQLVERGEKVRAFVLPGDKAMKFIPQEVEIVEGDLCDIHSLEKLFTVPEGYETIVMHIASIVTVNPDYNQKVMDVNVGGTQNIIDLCLLHKECKKLVYCSSTGAIPELPKGTAIAETYDFDTEKVVGCYSQSKALATKAVLDAVKNHGLNACVDILQEFLGQKILQLVKLQELLFKLSTGKCLLELTEVLIFVMFEIWQTEQSLLRKKENLEVATFLETKKYLSKNFQKWFLKKLVVKKSKCSFH